MSDTIFMRDLQFYGYHGVYEEERKLGQRFVVSVALTCDLQPASTTDDIALTVNYGEVYTEVKKVVEGPSKKLVEAVAEEIATTVLRTFPRVQSIRVRLEKPGAPIAGVFDTVGVEIERFSANAATAMQ